MKVFTLYDCDNITNSYLAYYKQKQITFRKTAQCEWTFIRVVFFLRKAYLTDLSYLKK